MHPELIFGIICLPPFKYLTCSPLLGNVTPT